MDRREFLKMTGTGMLGGTLVSGFGLGTALAGEAGGMQAPGLHLFSKVLQFLDYQDLAQTAATLGLNGLDLTVRPGGHVEPEDFERDLPAAVKAANEAGVACEMMVTNITGTQNQRDYDLLAMARSLGIKSYRTGGLRYDEHIPAMTTLEQYRDQLAALAEWNREIGITGMFQNHSGEKRLGAAVWDLYLVLKDLDPDYMGCQFDIRHAVTDGGLMWPDSFRLIKPYIRSLVFKDFKWVEVKDKWKFVSTPIGKGMVDFKRYFRMLKDASMNCPVSLHLEYGLGGAEKGRTELTVPEAEVLNAIKQDVDTIKRFWEAA